MHDDYQPMSLPMKLVLWLVVANAYAGALSLVLSPTDTQGTFFWRIAPPINAGMFGVLYLAAGSVVLSVVRRGRWEPARFLTAMVPAFTGLMLLTTLLHLDAFDPGGELAYWLAVYVVAPVAGMVFYFQHERGGATWRVVGAPLAPETRAAAVATGAGAALFVVLAYVFPQTVAERWPWPISPLMVRVFASWLSAFAVGLLWFAVDSDWSRVRPVATLLVGAAVLMLLMLVVHREHLTPGSASAVPIGAGVAGIGLLGAFMFWRQRAAPSEERWRAPGVRQPDRGLAGSPPTGRRRGPAAS
jgi:hypothetical protein